MTKAVCDPGIRDLKSGEIIVKVFCIFRKKAVAGAVFFRYGAYRAAGDAESDISCGNIAGNDAAGADNRAVSDMNAAGHAYVGGDPDVAAYVDVLGEFRHCSAAVFIQAHTLLSDKRMVGCKKGYVRSYAYVIADEHTGIVHNGKIEVGEEILADECMGAVIKIDGTDKMERISYAAENGAHYFIAFGISLWETVISLIGSMGFHFYGFQLIALIVEKFACIYFFFFTHGDPSPFDKYDFQVRLIRIGLLYEHRDKASIPETGVCCP